MDSVTRDIAPKPKPNVVKRIIFLLIGIGLGTLSLIKLVEMTGVLDRPSNVAPYIRTIQPPRKPVPTPYRKASLPGSLFYLSLPFSPLLKIFAHFTLLCYFNTVL